MSIIIHIKEQLRWNLVKNNTYIDFKIEVNDKDPKFKVGDHVKYTGLNKFFCK